MAQGSASTATSELVRLITLEGLTSVGRDGHAFPRLVLEYAPSNNGLEWRFTLRPNVTFHDGTPLTAEHVRQYILQRVAALGPLVALESVVVTKPDQVTVSLRQPSSIFIEELSEPVTRTTGAGTVGTGPFVRKPGSSGETVLEAFPNYYRGAPQLQRITMKAYPDHRSAYASLLRGQIDGVYDLVQDSVEFFRNQTAIGLYPYMRPYALVMTLNDASPKLADPRVRQALNMAINRAEVIELAMRGQGQEAGMPVSRTHWAFDDRRPGFTYDSARAIALLDAAGLTGHPRLRVTCVLPSGFDMWERAGLVMQRQLNELDIDLQFEWMPYADAMKRLTAGEFEALLTEMALGPGMNVQYRRWHSPLTPDSWNHWNYRSAPTDAALATIAAATDATEYRRGVSLLQQALTDDPPAVFISWLEASRAVSRRFAISVDAGHDIRETITSWRPLGAADLRRAH